MSSISARMTWNTDSRVCKGYNNTKVSLSDNHCAITEMNLKMYLHFELEIKGVTHKSSCENNSILFSHMNVCPQHCPQHSRNMGTCILLHGLLQKLLVNWACRWRNLLPIGWRRECQQHLWYKFRVEWKVSKMIFGENFKFTLFTHEVNGTTSCDGSKMIQRFDWSGLFWLETDVHFITYSVLYSCFWFT